ncbi:hypothetical protein [Absidia glauca]|uniref:Transcription factor IIA, alpha/beta subunit n=1 Tax=Absidia glauca TaxID=4829 RepID=A0A168MFC6_ABSGL|nr:hypothetical protein [Absidia glauca]
MSNAIVSNVYRYVIDDVINQVRGEFEDMGIDEAVLQELQRPAEPEVYTPSSVHQAAANLASLANDNNAGVRTTLPPLHTIQHPPPPTGPYPPMNLPRYPSQPNQQHTPDLHLPGGRPHIPQNDGVNEDPMTVEEIDAHLHQRIMDAHGDADDSPITFSATTRTGASLDLDSLPDSVKQLIKDARASRIAQVDGDGGDDDDINSDLDDTDDDDDDADGGEEVDHIILCLYDKVTRTKNRWKCVLRDGIVLVNGRDYLFHRANGDFEW